MIVMDRWRRRGAQAFGGIAVLTAAAGLSMAAAPSAAGAQIDAVTTDVTATGDTLVVYPLGEVIVLSTRDPVNRTAAVHEWGPERIGSLAPRDAEAALRYMPGLHFSRSTRNQATFRLRGFEQRQVSVFLDGVPISVPYDGLVDVSQLAGGDIDRVQVSHGMASVLYGANSLGGTVNILTRLPAVEPSARVRAERSTHGRTHVAAQAAGGVGSLRLAASASLDDGDGMHLASDFAPTANEDGGRRDNSGYSKRQGSIRAHYLADEDHQISLTVSAVDNRYDVPPNAVSRFARYWRFPEWKKQVVSLGTTHQLGRTVRMRTRLYHDGYQNRLESYDDDSYTTQERGYAFSSNHDDRSRGAQLFPSLDLLPFGATDAVVSYRNDLHREKEDGGAWERYAAETLTVGVEQDVAVSGSLSMVVGAGASWLRPEAGGAASAEPLSQLDGHWAVRYQPTESLGSHLSLSRKSRFPTLKEVHSGRLGRSVPNPDLRPETAVHAEVGFTLAAHGWHGSLSLFNSGLEDLIAAVVVEDGLEQMQNIRTARIRGVELDAGRDWESVSLAVNYSRLHARNTAEDRTSKYLEYRPEHRFNGLAAVRPTGRLEFGAEVSRTAGQYYQNTDSREWERLDDITWLNLRSEYDLGAGLSAYVRVDNVLDTALFGEFGVPLAGRELTLGSRLEL